MIQFQLSCFKVSNGFCSEAPWTYYPCTSQCDHNFSYIPNVQNSRVKRCMEEAYLGLIDSRKKSLLAQYMCSSSVPSTDREVELEGKIEVQNAECGNSEGQLGNLVSENGWQVRRMVENDEEMRRVAYIQAEAFHEPAILFNDLFFKFFQAEVLSALIYRLRNSPGDRYACLVAEPMDLVLEQDQQLVGVVDATVLRDNDVLQHLSGADEYLYVSGIAVLHSFRRKKVATALLKACEMLSILWGFHYLVLRAYEDDWGARNLYTNAGYRIVSGDPPWMTTWIGRRRRVLMIKRVVHDPIQNSVY